MNNMINTPNDCSEAAKVGGSWQPDGSRHALKQRLTVVDPTDPTLRVPPREGRRSLRVLYLFSGVSRKASIAQSLKTLCEADGNGLDFFEVDILVGGSAHDLLSKDVQESYIARILEGEFDIIILSPPCGSCLLYTSPSPRDRG